jgi:predicted dienelactone hydrolase
MEVLPAPTGPYPIGTLTRHWIGTTRPDLFAGPAACPRELMVQVWYPAREDGPRPRARYVDDPRVLEPLAELVGLPRSAFAHMAEVETHGLVDAPVADTGQPFPVVLFAHGRCGFRGHDTVQVEELASHGYVVVTVDQPFAASGVRFPDGRIVPFDTWLLPPWPQHPPQDDQASFRERILPFLTEDLRFVLDLCEMLADDRSEPLAGRLDLTRIGIIGMSLGGILAAEACARDPRLTAGLLMDVWVPQDVVETGLRQPMMWMTRDAATMRLEGWPEQEIETVHRSIRATFERLPGDGYIVLLPGAFHIDFSDGRLLSPLVATTPGISGPIDAARARDIVRRYTVAFFDRHLKDVPAPLLDESPDPDAGILLESRRLSGRTVSVASSASPA